MRPIKDRIARSIFLFCAGIGAIGTTAILLFMVLLGLPLFQEGSLLQVWTGTWAPHKGLYGIRSMIAGTIWIALLATIFSLPLSLGTSFVATCLGGRRLRNLMMGLIRFMTGIPTVIYGFLGIFLLVPLVREELGGPGMCMFTAAVVLAILITPTMVLFFSHALLAVDPAHVQAARALGADRTQRLLYVMLPRALGGMTTGLVLALGRATGDTLIALMIAGNALQIPDSLLSSARTLTSHIALVKAADYSSLEFKSIFACGIALYLFNTAAVIMVRLVENRRKFFA